MNNIKCTYYRLRIEKTIGLFTRFKFIAELRVPWASWVRKYGNLSLRETLVLVMTSPFVRPSVHTNPSMKANIKCHSRVTLSYIPHFDRCHVFRRQIAFPTTFLKTTRKETFDLIRSLQFQLLFSNALSLLIIELKSKEILNNYMTYMWILNSYGEEVVLKNI